MNERADTFVIDLRGARPRTGMTRSRAYALRIGGPRIRTQKELKSTFLRERGARRPTLFVSSTAGHLAALANVAHHEAGNLRLFVWETVKPERRDYLQTLFRTVVSVGGDLQLLASDELAEALSAENRGDLFVGGSVNRLEDVVVFYRGTLDRLSVPLEWFRRTSDSEPDFADFGIADHGRTVRFGDFEASTDAVLYDLDPDYRSRAKHRQLALDDTFGGSLRRLREVRGIRRTDFSPISSREIARIERGEVRHPRKATLEVIARCLDVTPEAIATY